MKRESNNARKRSYRERMVRARARARRKRRGVALILVLGAIVILTVFVTDLEVTSSAALSAAFAERDAGKAEYNARSAVNLSRLLIGSEPTIREALLPILQAVLGTKGTFKQLPVWKFNDVVLGPFNDAEHGQAFANAVGADLSDQGGGKGLGLRGGHFEVKIVDEDSKINVNSAVAGDAFSRQRVAIQLLGLMSPAQYTPLFEHKDADGAFSDRATICGAIIDWSDFDESFYNCDPFGNAPQNESAEDNFYQQMGLPYLRKNAPFDSLDELRLVRGISDEYWSTFVDPEPDDPEKRVLTVWGQGLINVNTANAQTLLAIVCAGAPDAKMCTDPAQMESFLTAITMAKAVAPGLPLFSSPKRFTRALQGIGSSVINSLLTALQIQPVVWRSAADVEKALTVESKVFSIYAEGVVPGRDKETRVRIHTVVDFRNSSALGAAATGSNGTLQGATPIGGANGVKSPTVKPGPTQTQSSSSGSSSGQPSDSDVMAALLTDPAGQVIYYRIE